MNPGGITVAASDISLSGSKAKMKNGAIEKAKNGTRLSFDVHFGSLPTYEKVEVDVQLNKKNRDTWISIWILKQFLLPRLMFRVPTLRISLHNLLFSTVDKRQT